MRFTDFVPRNPPPVNQISNRLAIFSWSLYDFANTIFSMNVISLYFALWVTVDHDGQDILYSTALSLSMLAVALSVPVFGALSDTTGKRRVPPDRTHPALRFLHRTDRHHRPSLDRPDFGSWWPITVTNRRWFFITACSPPFHGAAMSRLVSGYGVALGYLGSIIGMLMVQPFVESGGRSFRLSSHRQFAVVLLSCPAFCSVKGS